MIVRGVIKLGLISSICFALVACQEEQDVVQKEVVRGTPAIAPECSAGKFFGFIGQNADALNTLELPKAHRIIHPNTIVTADYIATRVNFLIDSAGLIEDVKCY